jgi:hypothetical protein
MTMDIYSVIVIAMASRGVRSIYVSREVSLVGSRCKESKGEKEEGGREGERERVCVGAARWGDER